MVPATKQDLHQSHILFILSLQYSVFICELSPAEKMILVGKLDEVIDHKIDRILIVDIGSSVSESENLRYFDLKLQ